MKSFKLQFIVFALMGILLLGSCEEDIVQQGPGDIQGDKFDIDLFIQNIVDRLDGNTVGYAWSVSKNGVLYQSGQGGDAVASWDTRNGGPIEHNANKRQDIASVSKTITALALLHLLDENNKSIEDPLSDFVPSHWEANGGTVHGTTLRQLLTHTSGFPQVGIDYDDLKDLYEGGGLYLNQVYDYNNSNFAMLRVVIAGLQDPDAVAAWAQAAEISKIETAIEAGIGNLYIEAVNEIVLTPSGVGNATMNPDDETNPTMNYNVNTQDIGWNKGDMRLFGGSAGWRLSAKELNSIVATLKYTEDIIDSDMKKLMDDNLLGWENSNDYDVTGGEAFGHGGYHEDQYAPNAASDPKVRGMFSIMVLFPNDVECAVVINSLGGTSNMNNEILPAYEGAWKL